MNKHIWIVELVRTVTNKQVRVITDNDSVVEAAQAAASYAEEHESHTSNIVSITYEMEAHEYGEQDETLQAVRRDQEPQ